MAIEIVDFTHKKWEFSIVMLVYQRVALQNIAKWPESPEAPKTMPPFLTQTDPLRKYQHVLWETLSFIMFLWTTLRCFTLSPCADTEHLTSLLDHTSWCSLNSCQLPKSKLICGFHICVAHLDHIDMVISPSGIEASPFPSALYILFEYTSTKGKPSFNVMHIYNYIYIHINIIYIYTYLY